tara:strand:+ start:546 stop:1028 length:483 start_codon:yes stop_codon:yes gene_type:complete
MNELILKKLDANEVRASKGVVNVVETSASFVASSDKITSGAMQLPPNAVILDCYAVVKTALAYATATLGTRFGTAASGAQIVALDADGLAGSGTSLAAGKGNSTDAERNTSLGGAAAVVVVADAAYSASGREIFGEVKASTGAFTAGEVFFAVEYMVLGD